MNTPTLATGTSQSPGRARIAAILVLLISLAGIGVSIYLTILKFRMLYTPCRSARGSCSVGGMTCEDALNSSGSMLLGLPISVWGAAFYVVTAVLAVGLLRRNNTAGDPAPALLLRLASGGALVSLALAIYAFGVLRSPCPFCLSLDALSAMLLAAAFYLRRARPGASAVPPLRLRQAAVLDAVFMLAVIFVIATGVQSVGYQLSRRFVDAQAGCPQPVAPLPPATIKIGASEPKAIVALFIDMTCSHCRAEFKVVVNALNHGQFPDPTQVRIYHTPRQACDPEAFPAGYAKSDANVRFDNACLAARAAECMEKLQPGAGVELIGGMYALHDNREPNTPLFTAERIGNQAVDLEMRIDPDDPQNQLFRCIDTDRAVIDTITAHQRYAEGPQYKVPTAAVYHAEGGEPDMTRKPLYGDANTPLETLAMYIHTQAGPAGR